MARAAQTAQGTVPTSRFPNPQTMFGAGQSSVFAAPRPMPIDEDDNRQCRRRSLHCEMLLIDNLMEESSSPPVIPAECLNISDGGLFGCVPLGYGVAVGQHYTFRLKIGERGPEPGSMQIVLQRGKILRAELMVGEDGLPNRVGVAVQLYGHREGVVPLSTIR